MDRKPDIFEKIAYLGIAIATTKMYVDLHSGRIHSSLGPVLSFFIDFALYYLIYRAGRFVWCKWIKVYSPSMIMSSPILVPSSKMKRRTI